METMRAQRFDISPDHENYDIPTPLCVKLLKAVLFRAFQDLSDTEHHVQREAAAWFRDTSARDPMSLFDICEYLDLNHLEVSLLSTDKTRVKALTNSWWRKG